jgi:hypothetical protein
MRMTPAQMAVHLICGHNLPMGSQHSLEETMKVGRAMLARIVGIDYGYDLQRWHDHLKVSREGGYTWNRTIALPKVMQEALASQEWRHAASELAAALDQTSQRTGRASQSS